MVSGPQIKATREDWIAAALDALVEHGVQAVKILPLAVRLGVARSSFYWYFTNRDQLLSVLLEHWQDTNTRTVIEHASRPAPDITGAVLAVFECWTDVSLFDARLDFAVREWARRSGEIEQAVRSADDARLRAITSMFERHGFERRDAFVRARVLYFSQIGYYALDLGESLETRLSYAGDYVAAYTGSTPDEVAVLEYVERRMP
jgi:AcrR family transcriptional regulator